MKNILKIYKKNKNYIYIYSKKRLSAQAIVVSGLNI